MMISDNSLKHCPVCNHHDLCRDDVRWWAKQIAGVFKKKKDLKQN